MLNLRQLRTCADAEAPPWTQYSTIAFNPTATALVGNIGELLDVIEPEHFGCHEWHELGDVSDINICEVTGSASERPLHADER